tara:strand:- start:92 stop:799 length:708 start_codon:yes stop_codon:yes gene_type:complete
MKYIRLALSLFDYFTQKAIFNKIKSILIGKINTVIDVGAHEGEFALNFNKKFNVEKIISFEPNIKVFKILNKNIFNYKNMYAVNSGVGSREEKKILNINTESSSSSLNELRKDSNYYKKKFFFINLFKGEIIKDRLEISILKLDDFIIKNDISSIDLLKIDTEGFEFDVLKGANNNLKKIKVIYFEHHFDNMLVKNYTLSDIHDYLVQNNFKKYFKIKMKFRKSFEYIYINNHLI